MQLVGIEIGATTSRSENVYSVKANKRSFTASMAIRSAATKANSQEARQERRETGRAGTGKKS